MVKIKDLRKWARLTLADSGNEDYAADIDVIFGALGFLKGEIVLGDAEVTRELEEKFRGFVDRLKEGEPVQYIVGRCEFMSLEFGVNRHTLIPRQDTEVLVEEVLNLCRSLPGARIFEVGSGSGCIAVSLAKFLPGARVVSADISPGAIAVAEANARAHGVEDSVEFIRHDILTGFPEFVKDADVVVSNPPYIPKGDIEGLDRKVKAFEPLSALDGGDDGLDFYRFMCQNTPQKTGSYLAFEVGIGQAQSVAGLMAEKFDNIRIIKDLADIDRVVIGKKV